jgi:hypothetical protein
MSMPLHHNQRRFSEVYAEQCRFCRTRAGLMPALRVISRNNLPLYNQKVKKIISF